MVKILIVNDPYFRLLELKILRSNSPEILTALKLNGLSQDWQSVKMKEDGH